MNFDIVLCWCKVEKERLKKKEEVKEKVVEDKIVGVVVEMV